MVSISGSKKLKRQMAPLFWGITRKDSRFVVTVRPGGHPKHVAIPTAVFVRDTLKLVTTLREAKSVIYGGKIKVDGITRRSLHHGIGSKTQIGFHDGRSIISDAKVNVGDTCIMQIPEGKLLDVIKLEKGCQVIVTRGINAGHIGKVVEIKEGTFVLPRRALVNIGEREIEIPVDLVMAVGKDKPVIQLE